MHVGVSIHFKVEEAISYTLAYFEIFSHPLSLDEIVFYAPISISREEVSSSLSRMLEAGKVFSQNGYFSLADQPENVQKRQQHNGLAKGIMPQAIASSRLIHRFPFIKGVCISGSLSKEVFMEEDDIDFFIITAKNRIWISRLLLKAYKWVWLKNSRKYFCINYFISEKDLEIKEKNLFTAIELVTLIPLMDPLLFDQLKRQNVWISSFLPNGQWKENDFRPLDKPLISRLLEFLSWGPVGDMADLLIMKGMKWRNRMKYKQLVRQAEFDHMFKSTRTESKIHPLNMSRKIQLLHQEKLEKLGIQ